MLKISQLERINVFRPGRKATGDPAKMRIGELTLVGKVHLTVFDPKGTRVVGFLVKRPDVASMIKVADAFLALDSFVACDAGLVATRGDDSFDGKARERLGLDWDRCLIWGGMDARTTDGKALGWVSDVEFEPKTGRAKTFYLGEGAVSTALVGTVEVPATLLRGYRDGFMLLDPSAAGIALNGGAAARAGEAYAKAKYSGARAAKKAASSAESAVGKGAFRLGKMLGDTKRAFEEAAGDERPPARDVPSVSAPVEEAGILGGEVGQPREFVPVSELPAEADDASGRGDAKEKASPKKSPLDGASSRRDAPATKRSKKKPTADTTARTLGRQLGKTKGMFSDFMSEYRKASR